MVLLNVYSLVLSRLVTCKILTFEQSKGVLINVWWL